MRSRRTYNHRHHLGLLTAVVRIFSVFSQPTCKSPLPTALLKGLAQDPGFKEYCCTDASAFMGQLKQFNGDPLKVIMTLFGSDLGWSNRDDIHGDDKANHKSSEPILMPLTRQNVTQMGSVMMQLLLKHATPFSVSLCAVSLACLLRRCEEIEGITVRDV